MNIPIIDIYIEIIIERMYAAGFGEASSAPGMATIVNFTFIGDPFTQPSPGDPVRRMTSI